ncbi:MAG: response regulator [Hyphomicrobiales bacterium]|nr:response regulator [Hyphomicrobiales bacterium]
MSGQDYRYILDGGVRILVVDDDPIQREFATVFLSGPEASVETACDGAEGLAKLRAGRYDIVLLDLEMPVMNGLETLRAIRADSAFAYLPVIMVTSCEDMASIDSAYDNGATSFVTKPVNWRLLAYQVRYVLRASGYSRAA